MILYCFMEDWKIEALMKKGGPKSLTVYEALNRYTDLRETSISKSLMGSKKNLEALESIDLPLVHSSTLCIHTLNWDRMSYSLNS